jgi:hypothetical protein
MNLYNFSVILWVTYWSDMACAPLNSFPVSLVLNAAFENLHNCLFNCGFYKGRFLYNYIGFSNAFCMSWRLVSRLLICDSLDSPTGTDTCRKLYTCIVERSASDTRGHWTSIESVLSTDFIVIPCLFVHLYATGFLWRRQSQQSFNTLTPFYFPSHSPHVSAPTGHLQGRYTIWYS